MAQTPQREFKSRYADPNNPAASGSLISFVSGGHLVPAPDSRGLIGGVVSVIDQAVRGVPQGYGKGPEYYERTYGPDWQSGTSARRRDRRGGDPLGTVSPIGMVKKVLKQVSGFPLSFDRGGRS